MFKKLCRLFAPNPLDRKLKHLTSPHPQVLIAWNRGLGDIPLGLFALKYRIMTLIPQAQVTFITRRDLKEGFDLLEGARVIVAPDWKRGVPFDFSQTLHQLQIDPTYYDLILEHPDPTHWVKWQLGKLTPKLQWKSEWDFLSEKFKVSRGCVGIHVQTETQYGYEKNWPLSHWRALFAKILPHKQVVLFGFNQDPLFTEEGVIDLRGKTTFIEMLSLIKNRCSHLVVPDSGVLSTTYYLDVDFPIRVVSLWADPRQGVIKQNVPSPNPSYQHIPLFGKKEQVCHITVDQVMRVLDLFRN